MQKTPVLRTWHVNNIRNFNVGKQHNILSNQSKVAVFHHLFDFQDKPKMFSKDTEVNIEAVTRKLIEITSARGKKGTDRQEQIELLKELYSISETNNLGYAISVKLSFNIIAAIYDYNPNIATHMRSEMWEL